MKIFYRLLFVAFLAIAFICQAALTDAPNLDVEIIPKSISLEFGKQSSVTVIIHNSSPSEITHLRLGFQPIDGITVLVTPKEIASLAPNDSIDCHVTVEPVSGTSYSGPLLLRFDYQWKSSPDNLLLQGIQFAEIGLTTSPAKIVADLVDVQVQTTLSELTEQQPGWVYLILHNLAEQSITVQSINLTGPDFVQFTPSIEFPFSIMGGKTSVIPLQVSAKESVRPGKHLLLFDLGLSWLQGSESYSSNLVATREVEVGVVGVSEILKVLAVPSFFLLPGFLMLVTAGWLWNLTASKGREFPFKLLSPEYWLLATTLSFAAAFLYPVLTKWLTGIRRDYLVSYGLTDIVTLWIASIVVVLLVYVVIVGGYRLIVFLIHWWKTPNSEDQPTTILRKLHRQNLSLSLDRVSARRNGKSFFAYLLEPEQGSDKSIWSSPRIEIEWLQGAPANFREQVEAHMGLKGSPLILARLLDEGRKNGYLRYEWNKDENAGFMHPLKLSKEEIASHEQPNFFVIEK